MLHGRVSFQLASASLATLALHLSATARGGEHWIEAQTAKLTAQVPGAGALFGRAIDHEGTWAVFGAPLADNSFGTDAGTCYVFGLSAGRWEQVAELIGSGGSSTDLFGESVAISGSTIVVGAYLDDPLGFSNAGSAYVFEYCNGAWVETAKLVHPNPSSGDRFGYRVAIAGDTILVTSQSDATCALRAGSAFVFERADAGTPDDRCDDSWWMQAELQPSTCEAMAEFGSSADVLENGRIAIGAPSEDVAGVNSGAVYFYERLGNVWQETAKLVAADALDGDAFGGAVSLSGDRLLIGAAFDDDPEVDRGSAYVFRQIAGTWFLERKLTGSSGQAGHMFGFDVEIDGELLVIGGFGADDAGVATGAVHLFRYSDSNSWLEEQRITPTDASAGDEFGIGLALVDSTVFCGAQRDDDNNTNSSGSAYVFALSYGGFQRFGFGDGVSTACPCGNDSLPGLEQGCRNSLGRGGSLSIAGSDSAAADNFMMLGCNLLPANPALLFHGTTAVNGGTGTVFGNGLRLVGGFVVRAGVRSPDSLGCASWGPGIGATNSWPVGLPVHFQVWYRDPFHASCGAFFNLTNGVTVNFRP